MTLAALPPFIRWYMEAAGEYLVPPVFHYWSALSLLAAFSAKRYWYEHIRGNPLHPNLYIGLFSHSAAGKGLAIRNAVTLIRPGLVHEGKDYGFEFPYFFQGRVTSQGLVDMLTRISRKLDGESVEFYLVCPELGQSLDMPPTSVSGFVRMMTGAYDDTGAPWSDMTRMHGFRHAPQAYINWFFGTTAQWFRGAIQDIDFEGGLAGRIIPVIVENRQPFRYRPSYSMAQAELLDYLQMHLRMIRSTGGPFTMATDAEEMDEMWCAQRYENLPGDERMHPFVLRGGTLAKKLAMLFSLARNVKRRIEVEDMRCAQQAVQAIEADLPRVLDLVFTNEATRLVEAMTALIREHRRVARSMVMRYLMQQRGVTRKEVLETEATLVFAKIITVDYQRDEYVLVEH